MTAIASDDCLDGEVVAQRAPECWVSLGHRDPRGLDPPSRLRERRRVSPVPDEDVIQSLGARVRDLRVDGDLLAPFEPFPLLLGPPPGVERAVAGRAVLGEIELRRRDGSVPLALCGVDGCA